MRPAADTDGLARWAAGLPTDELFSRESWRACAAAGLTGLPVDRAWGGQSATFTMTAELFESFGRAGAPPGLVFALGAQLWSVTMVLARFGSSEQHARWLPALCTGDAVAAHGMTEPDTGSDALSLTTHGHDDGARIVLDGVKTFVTNAPSADVVLVFATSDRALGWAGIDAYLVARGTPGLSVGPLSRTMSPAAAPMADVLLESCAVTPADRLGSRGSGTAMFTYAMELERSLLAAGLLGVIAHCLDTVAESAVALTRERGASLSTRLMTCRLLVRRATARLDGGQKAARESSLAKLSTSELWSDVARFVVDHTGPAGLLASSSALLGDGVAGRIYSGTSELQREILGHRLGLR